MTAKNREEITKNADIARLIWLSEPKNLELYIFVDNENLVSYMRIGSAQPPVDNIKCKPLFTETIQASGSATYAISSVAVTHNRAFCSTKITPEILSLLPPPTNTFITEYIRRRVKRVAQFMLQTNTEYNSAFTKYKGYLTDICGAANELLAKPLQTRINAWGANSTQKALFTRMIIEKKRELDVIPSTDPDYIQATAAYDRYKAAVSKTPNIAVIMGIDVSTETDPVRKKRTLSAVVTDFLFKNSSGNPVTPAPSKKSEGYLGTMIIRDSSNINATSADDADYLAAQVKYTIDMKTITGDTTVINNIKAKTIPQRAYDKGVSQYSLEAAYLIIMLYSYEYGVPNTDLCNISPKYFEEQMGILLSNIFAGSLLPLETRQSITTDIMNASALTTDVRTTILGKIPGTQPLDEKSALLTNIKNRQIQLNILSASIKAFDEIKSIFAALTTKPSGAALNTWVGDKIPSGTGDKIPSGTGDLFKSYVIMMLLTADTKIEPFREPSPILATMHFNTREPNIRKLIDQVATQYYVLRGGVEAISYVYEIFPVGSTILDLRCDIMSYAAGVADAAKNDIMSLNTRYMSNLNKNLSANQLCLLSCMKRI